MAEKSRNKKIYKCDICFRTDYWDDSWQWFGSYKDLDNQKPILITCSYKCRKSINYKQAIILQKEKLTDVTNFT